MTREVELRDEEMRSEFEAGEVKLNEHIPSLESEVSKSNPSVEVLEADAISISDAKARIGTELSQLRASHGEQVSAASRSNQSLT
jgi:predicted  nucleic acid-binding Zn-ribbon protein